MDRLKHGNSRYTPEQKMSAVVGYVMTGNLSETARLVNLEYPTLRKWKQEAPWWNDACRAAQKYLNQKLDGRLTRMINKMVSRIEEKLEDDVIPATTLINGLNTIFTIRERTRETAYELKDSDSPTINSLDDLHSQFARIGKEH